MKLDLENKVVLVTDSDSDSASGIIAVIKHEGAVVIACVEQGQAEPIGAEAVYRYDLSDYEQTEALRDEIAKKFGRLDAVIFNRNEVKPTGLLTQDAVEFIDRMRLPRAAFICCKVLGQYIGDLGRGGSIVFVTTLHDEKPNGCDFVHSITQGMIENLVMESCMEYGVLGVRTVQISMGPVEGTAELFRNDISNFNEGAKYKIPLCRLGSTEDLANMAAFLISDRASFMNGTRVRLDGGLVNEYLDHKANYRAHMAQQEVR